MKTTTIALFLTLTSLTVAVNAQTPTPTGAQPSMPAQTAPATTDANNTARNAGDAKAGASTADQQPNNPTDLKLVQAIRQGVIADKSLSIDAKNCKIIVVDGVVTLRGPVNSEAEHATLVRIATEIAGKGKVSDSLEVKMAAR